MTMITLTSIYVKMKVYAKPLCCNAGSILPVHRFIVDCCFSVIGAGRGRAAPRRDRGSDAGATVVAGRRRRLVRGCVSCRALLCVAVAPRRGGSGDVNEPAQCTHRALVALLQWSLPRYVARVWDIRTSVTLTSLTLRPALRVAAAS